MLPQRLTEDAGRFLAFIRSRIQDPATAEDVLQESFVKALKAQGNLKDPDKVIAWFFQIIRNTIIDVQRKQNTESRLLAQLPPQTFKAAEEEGIHKVLCDCIDLLTVDLRPEYSDIIRSLDIEEENPDAYATRKGISSGALKVKRHRARKQLREKILAICNCFATDGQGCEC